MQLSTVTADLLAQPALRLVLERVASAGSLRRAELIDPQRSLSALEVDQAVTRLKQDKLVDEAPAPIKDFNTVYITASGLRANREVPHTRR